MILLAEDNSGDVRLIREALAAHGVTEELVVVSDGEAATRFIEELDGGQGDCPSLVIVDLNLPKRPGRDVLKAVRQSEKCSESKVAILTSSDAARDRMDSLNLGANRYLLKPFRLKDFLKLGAVFKALIAEGRAGD